MFPLNTRQFSTTFLDFSRNSRGYVDEVRPADRDASKKLLSPVLKESDNSVCKCIRCIPLLHPLGNIMWDFARQCTVMQSQSNYQGTGFNSHAYYWSSHEEYAHSPDDVDDDDDNDDSGDDDDDSDNDGDGDSDGDDDDDDDIDDDDDDNDDDDDGFQFGPCREDGQSCNSVLSIPCFTSNVPIPSGCKTNELSKETYWKDTGILQDDISAGTSSNKAANVTDNFNDTTATGLPNSCSNLQNRDSYPLTEFHVNLEVGTTEDQSYNDNSRSSFNDGDDGVDSSCDNRSNAASQDVKLHHVGEFVEQANFLREAESSYVLNDQENKNSLDNDFLLGDGLFLNEKTANSEESLACIPCSGNNIKQRDVSNGHYLSYDSVNERMGFSNELLYGEPLVKPLPLYKQGKCNKKTISTSLNLNVKLKVLKSVLHTETKLSRNGEIDEVDICGKVAILHGFLDDGNSCISVLESEVVGLYDYVKGMVHLLEQPEYHHQADNFENENIKDPLPPSTNISVDLHTFLVQYCCISGASLLHRAKAGKSLKEHFPVAWLLTSPALGVMLDWQVQEQLLKCTQKMDFDKSNDEEKESKVLKSKLLSSQWYNVLVVVDEYRCVEKDIPLVEVYKLCSNGIINLVNFDLN